MYRNKPILFCTAKMLVSHACKCLRLLRHMNIDLSILILFMYTVNRQLPNDVFYKPQTHTHTHKHPSWEAKAKPIHKATSGNTHLWNSRHDYAILQHGSEMQDLYNVNPCQHIMYGPDLQNWMLCPFHLYYSNWYDMHLLYLACMSTAYNANTACFLTSVELRDPFNAILHHAMPCSASGRLLHVRCRQA